MEVKSKAKRGGASTERLRLVAEILASAIVRKRMRDVRNQLKKNKNPENGLEVSSPKSLDPLEPKQRGERR